MDNMGMFNKLFFEGLIFWGGGYFRGGRLTSHACSKNGKVKVNSMSSR